jgi:uncharacterized protein (TIGR02391 family)
MIVSELIQGIECLIAEIDALDHRKPPKNQSEEGWRLWHEERQKQAQAMLRTLGRLKPFIHRFRNYPAWIVGMHGRQWNVLDNLAETELIGGVSRSKSLEQLSEVLGLLSAYPEDAEVPLEGEIRLTKTPPIQEVMAAYLPHLHPALQKASQLFLNAHFTEAAREACLGLLARIKALTGRDEDGIDLVNRVFGKTPALVLGDQTTETGQNRQEGLGQALRGFVKGVRNPLFHESGELPAQEAFEWMVTASRLCHLLDECKQTP